MWWFTKEPNIYQKCLTQFYTLKKILSLKFLYSLQFHVKHKSSTQANMKEMYKKENSQSTRLKIIYWRKFTFFLYFHHRIVHTCTKWTISYLFCYLWLRSCCSAPINFSPCFSPLEAFVLVMIDLLWKRNLYNDGGS